MTHEPAIQTLIGSGTLRHISSEGGEHEYAIDTLRHSQLTGLGRQKVTCSLLIHDTLDEHRFEIVDESDYQGGDCLLATDDAEEVVCWIVGDATEWGRG